MFLVILVRIYGLKICVFKHISTHPDNFKVALHPDFSDQEVAIGGTLSAKGCTELCSILKNNLDIFAWQPSDMTGVSRSVSEHRLNIREGYSPVRQKKRGQAPERAKAIQVEVQKLVEAGIMRKVYYHDWLSNSVMVKKHDGSWRMCVDFTDLNKACLQDCYPLPEIDWKVEYLYGYPFKCFLDAYKGYHQMQLAEPNEEKITFHTGQGVYCYTKMPFGLKNAGATYQRLMDKAFESQIGRNIKVYVDDLVVKSYTGAEILRDIEETFRTLRKINMKLNPKKCAFGLAEGVFLGYVVTPDGIKPCPDKTAVVLQLPSPQTIKEVQSLNGKLASLNRFLSKSAEKSLPLFKTLRKCIKNSDFHWTAEAEQAFKQLKQHLSELPLLVAPRPKEELIIYLFATYRATSAVLMTERGATQTPIYFISRAPELNYTPMEKLVLSLVFAAKRLRRTAAKMEYHARRAQYYVQAKNVSQRIDLSGFSHRDARRKPTSRASDRNSTRAVDTFHGRFIMSSNNEAEYEALIAGLRITAQMGVKNVHVSVDSKLVANQVLGMYVAKEDNMVKYLDKVKSLVRGFTFSIIQVPRSKNKKADALSKIASTSFAHLSKQRYEGGKKAPHQSPTVRVNGGNSLQAVVPHAVVKMCWTTPGGGIDIAGPFPEGPGKVKLLLVAMDYFTKWIEAKAVVTITGSQVKKFVWDNIVCRFGIPGEIVSDNGKQFSDNPFKDWRDKLNITQRFASVEEIPHVLWAHRTMIKSSHGDTPFSLTYGTEAVIPTEIGMPTYRTAAVDVVSNDEELRLNLDLLEERRECACVDNRPPMLEKDMYDSWKSRMELYMLNQQHGRMILESVENGPLFWPTVEENGVTRPGDFVYRSNDASYAVAGRKLGPK
nr:reverse transcriptase domain-containing protein [Tanacetum cinerariifolium]